MRRIFREPVYHRVEITMFDLERDEPLHERNPFRVAYVSHHPFTVSIMRILRSIGARS